MTNDLCHKALREAEEQYDGTTESLPDIPIDCAAFNRSPTTVSQRLRQILRGHTLAGLVEVQIIGDFVWLRSKGSKGTPSTNKPSETKPSRPNQLSIAGPATDTQVSALIHLFIAGALEVVEIANEVSQPEFINKYPALLEAGVSVEQVGDKLVLVK